MTGYYANEERREAQRASYAQQLLSEAEQGSAFSALMLGERYHAGNGGMPQDTAEAVRWYRQAAEQGLKNAQFKLGEMFLVGDGVPQDTAEAVRLYRQAAEQTPRDESWPWRREQGDKNAQFALGKMFLYGVGVPQDSAEAYVWLSNAFEQGGAGVEGRAGLLLGEMFLYGVGVPQDSAEAYMYLTRAGYLPRPPAQ